MAAEIDRYAVTPGQALSYMIGRLEIQRIRRDGEERQGDAFDIKAFHDAVLDSGPMPLGLLDARSLAPACLTAVEGSTSTRVRRSVSPYPTTPR